MDVCVTVSRPDDENGDDNDHNEGDNRDYPVSVMSGLRHKQLLALLYSRYDCFATIIMAKEL